MTSNPSLRTAQHAHATVTGIHQVHGYDDSVDILLRLWGAELQTTFGSSVECALVASRITDNVAANDVPYLPFFPYLGLPHEGFNHSHAHNQ